jgi:membrane protein DedA with SNARE-associated domain
MAMHLVGRVVVSLVLIGAALWCLNLAIFNWWASGVPSHANDTREYVCGWVWFGVFVVICSGTSYVVIRRGNLPKRLLSSRR